MILAIDVGNTNIVLGCIDSEKIINIIRVRTQTNATEAEYGMQLSQILRFQNIDPSTLEAVMLSSVVPQATEAIKGAVRLVTGRDAMAVGPGMKTGMNVRIDDPGTLAADIVVGSVAAIEYYGTPSIIIDMGTASTMVVVDKNKNYLGGAIIPGVKLSFNALAAGASLLPHISITAPQKCISTNTVDSMRSGAVYGTASMLDGMIERMEAELGMKCTVVATGGLAKSIVPFCRHEIICDDDLLLKGLWALYLKNK